jgi:hypothetical protein
MKRLLSLALLFLAAPLFAQDNVITFSKPAVRDSWADIAGAADLVDPGNPFMSAGWLNSGTPPARQFFNFILNYTSNGIRYFEQRGIVDYDAAETYQQGAVVQSGGIIYASLVANNTGHTPLTSLAQWGGVSLAPGVSIVATAGGGVPLTVTGNSANSVINSINNGGGGSFLSTLRVAGTGLEIVSPAATNSNVFTLTQSGTGSTWTLANSATTNNLVIGGGSGGTTWTPAGNVGISAPSSGISLAVNAGVSSGTALALNGSGGGDSLFQLSDAGNGNGVNVQMQGNGTTTPSKFLRVISGSFAIANSAFTEDILSLDDAGDLNLTGTINAALVSVNGTNLLTTAETFATTAENGAISTAEAFTNASVAGLAPLASPGFSGDPTAPTADAGTNSAQIATTKFVQETVNPGASVTSPGFQILESGIIFEYGEATCTSVSPGTTITFPHPFPHNSASIQVTAFGQNAGVTVLSHNGTSFTCINGSNGGTFWFAVGF